MGVIGRQQLTQSAVAGGDIPIVTPQHGLDDFAAEPGISPHGLPQQLLIYAGVNAGHGGVAIDQQTGRLVIHVVVIGRMQIALTEQPRLIRPAHGVVVGAGGAVEFLGFIIGRQGGVVRLRPMGDAVQHIHEFAHLCRGLSAEGVRRFRVYISVAVHIEDAGLVENARDVRKHHRILQRAAAGRLAKNVGVVVTVDDVAGHLELIVHIQPVGLQLLVRNNDALVGGDHRLRAGVIAEGLCQEGLVRQHRYVYAVGQHVGARQQPGVVVHAEQVQQRGQDVRRGAVLIHHDILGQAGHIADEAVAVLLEGEIHLPPCQLVVLILRQTVGIVVIGQYDAGLIGHARLLQPLQQVGQRVFQLQIAGDIRLHRLGIGQILHRVAVFGAHGVVPVVLVVTAEGHVIGVEGFSAVEVVVHGGLHHLQIGGGPVDLYIQPGVRRLEGIAHVGVGDVPVVEIADIVVIAPGLVSLLR